ncbi:helix-turn-helix domain-containing protein [Candidatus Woesearchaeota archaeon]|nr:helix-turn-helix domain-containing protein [Candidatus Woesearchaeota archaeon]
MDISGLKKIGLTSGEIRLYSALLELGESTRTMLAKKSGISPSKIYDVANRLLEKGIVSSVKKNGVIHFSAANPERIKDFLERKGAEIEREKELVDGMLPALMAKYSGIEAGTDIEVFYGWEGMKTVFNDIARTLKKGDDNYIFGASLGQTPELADRFFNQYYRKVNEKGYTVHIIFNENLRDRMRTNYFQNNPPHEVRYLYQDTFAELNLYKDTVLFIMLLRRPIVIRIRNREAMDACKKFFDTMWGMAKK